MTEQTENWLTDAYDYEMPRRGQIRRGVILAVEDNCVIVDVGLKRDGLVPQTDLERLGKEASSQLAPGQEVTTRVLRPQDRDGNLILSLYQARLEKYWKRAQALLDSGEIWRGTVTGYNRGGLQVRFNGLRGFVPGSHLWSVDRRRLSNERRQELFEEYVDRELPLKVIEVDRERRRLIFSERLAHEKMRERHKERLLNELSEGQVREGTVCRLCDFGAFVDLGGADGLIHISELAWQRVRHPSQVLQEGEQIKVYVLRLDHERQRIGLSLKRLSPNPWELVNQTYTEGQLVLGTVTNIVDFGAFVALDVGVEGLMHISELSDPPLEDPRTAVKSGQKLLVRILSIDSSRRRIGLSLKAVSEADRERWLAEQSTDTEPSQTLSDDQDLPDDQQASRVWTKTIQVEEDYAVLDR